MPQYATLDIWPCVTYIKDGFFKLVDFSQSSLISGLCFLPSMRDD